MSPNNVTASAHRPGEAKRAVAEGLFEGMGSDARLLGSRCLGCGASYFPRGAGCRNPACRDRRITPVALSCVGTLYSYTVQSYQPPGLFRMDNWAPYPLGLIELPEGLRVMAMLTGCGVEELRIGMPVEMTTEALYRDDSGCEVHTYKFRPLTTAGEKS